MKIIITLFATLFFMTPALAGPNQSLFGKPEPNPVFDQSTKERKEKLKIKVKVENKEKLKTTKDREADRANTVKIIQEKLDGLVKTTAIIQKDVADIKAKLPPAPKP